jgi:Tfp pilus assembly protein PilN
VVGWIISRRFVLTILTAVCVCVCAVVGQVLEAMSKRGEDREREATRLEQRVEELATENREVGEAREA